MARHKHKTMINLDLVTVHGSDQQQKEMWVCVTSQLPLKALWIWHRKEGICQKVLLA